MLEEDRRHPYTNLVLSNGYSTLPRLCVTPVVIEVNKNYYITKVSGVSIPGFAEVSCTPKKAEDLLDFIVDSGTCYLASSPNFIPLFIKLLPPEVIRDLINPILGSNYSWKNYNITLRKSSLLVRKGNRYGRLYSFWDAYPADDFYRIGSLDLEPSPISLQDFFTIFCKVWMACHQSGLSIDTLTSAASISQSYLLKMCPGTFKTLKDLSPSILEYAHQCYKGQRFEAVSSGTFEGFYYDIVSAYPSIISSLVLPSDLDWVLDSKYHPEAVYGFAYVEETPTKEYNLSPTMFRFKTPLGYRLAGLTCSTRKWLAKPEIDLDINSGLATLKFLKGWWGIPKGSIVEPLRAPMNFLFHLRQDPLLGRLAKSASQTIAGKMGSSWQEDILEVTKWADTFEEMEYTRKTVTKTSSIFQIIFSSTVNSAIRAKVTELALEFNGVPRADGVVTSKEIPKSRLSDLMGGLVKKNEGKQVVIDDLLYGQGYLEALEGSQINSTSFNFTQTLVTSIQQASYTSRHPFGWTKKIGVPFALIRKRRVGSRKRIPIGAPPTIKEIIGGKVESSPPSSEIDLHYIMMSTDPLDNF